ncbi:hypothetical protein [Photorhabdus akhurstii]|uniref:hypothetical protein n=1 Tax=Photorhabdus akhurstii TaxID=171438 RepID=UPI001C2F066C|nr:hypothetical protein [Photorhabdus akhurstii]
MLILIPLSVLPPSLVLNLKDKIQKKEKPETRNQKPETRNQKPETRNQKPETRNQKPETRNQKPETRKPKYQFNENKEVKYGLENIKTIKPTTINQ